MIKVKICGLTRLEDAHLAVSAGADYLGFIFSESPRKVTAVQVQKIIEAVPQRVERVGVFVNESESFIRQAARQARLSMIQLHGDETPEFCRLFNLPVIKALRTKDDEILKIISKYETEYILLEPYISGKYGGTGRTVDWNLARKIIRAFPDKKFFLAGGLNPENARLALEMVKPYALDASSGLEDSPGVKNPGKIEKFIEVVTNL